MVERNLIVANREGFNFREQTRTTPRIGKHGEESIWNHDEQIRHNIIALNRDAQIWGWFDMNDGRHWPANDSGKESSQGRNVARPGDIAGAYTAKGGTSQPGNMTLDQLRLRFEDNDYFAEPGQGWFEWGVTWGRHKSYPTLNVFQAGLGIDKGSRVFRPEFAELRGLDLRLSAGAMAELNPSYPQGPVPGVILGKLP
jgi:hypothetical protein